MRTAIGMLEKIERKQFRYYKELGIDTYNSFIDSSFEWACDSCLTSKKAVLANPGLQEASVYPNLAYCDSKRNCRTCGSDFIFSADEKKLWYESLKFPSSAVPVDCLSCRKDKRRAKANNKVLTDILKKDTEDIPVSDLEKVVAVYRNTGKEEKAKFYESAIKKKLKDESSY